MKNSLALEFYGSRKKLSLSRASEDSLAAKNLKFIFSLTSFSFDAERSIAADVPLGLDEKKKFVLIDIEIEIKVNSSSVEW